MKLKKVFLHGSLVTPSLFGVTNGGGIGQSCETPDARISSECIAQQNINSHFFQRSTMLYGHIKAKRREERKKYLLTLPMCTDAVDEITEPAPMSDPATTTVPEAVSPCPKFCLAWQIGCEVFLCIRQGVLSDVEVKAHGNTCLPPGKERCVSQWGSFSL